MKKQLKHFLKLFELKEPNSNEWSPGLLGTLIPMVRANPIKLPLLSPIYITVSFLALGAGLVGFTYEEVKKGQKKQNENYIEELANNLTVDKHEEFKNFIQKTPYDNNSWLYHLATKSLVQKNNQEGLKILLENIHIKNELKPHSDTTQFNELMDDVFYTLSYNLPMMKKVMSDNMLENIAQEHQKPFEIDVDKHKNNIPIVLAANNRRSDSSVANTITYLNTLPDTWSFTPNKSIPSSKNKL